MPIEYNLPAEDYHRQIEYVSKHDLDIFRRSPAHYFVSRMYPKSDTPAMKFGRLVHTAILEPDKLAERYAVLPKEIKGRTKAAQEARAEFEAANVGKELVSFADHKRAMDIHWHVRIHEAASNLLGVVTQKELSLFVEDEHGTKRRSRIDAIADFGQLDIVDIKTTHDAGKLEFAKDVWNYRYHVQAAYYLDNARLAGLDAKRFKMIVAETEPPFAVAVYTPSEESIETGRREYQKQLELYRECLEFNSWPAYSQKEQEISLPAWAIKQAA
jgi:hypothetical protein